MSRYFTIVMLLFIVVALTLHPAQPRREELEGREEILVGSVE